MVVWPALARALCARYGVRAPIVQAPMADAVDWRVAAGAARAGILGSIPCATLAADAIAPAVERFREGCDGCEEYRYYELAMSTNAHKTRLSTASTKSS